MLKKHSELGVEGGFENDGLYFYLADIDIYSHPNITKGSPGYKEE